MVKINCQQSRWMNMTAKMSNIERFLSVDSETVSDKMLCQLFQTLLVKRHGKSLVARNELGLRRNFRHDVHFCEIESYTC